MVDEDNKNSSQGNRQKKYTIPRKKRLFSKDCQQEVTLDSREAKDLINTVNHLTWEAGELERRYTIFKVYKVENPVLEKEFQTKRSQMREEGRSTKELTESLAFKAEHLNAKAKEYCKQGLCCPGTNNILGDAKMGVSLWRCPDLCLKSIAMWSTSWTAFLVVFRVVKGRVKPVTIQQGNEGPCKEPTPNYDCHISKNIPNQNPTSDTTELMNRTQYYLYEYNEEGLTVNRPRQCLPYAVIHIRKSCSTPVIPDIRQLSLIDEQMTSNEPIKKSTLGAQDETKKYQYIDELQGTMAWRGLVVTKSHSLGVVALLAGHKISLKIWKSFLDIRSKIPLDNLLKVLPGDIRTAWHKPLNYRGCTFSLCTLKPCGLSENYINFIKSLSLRDHSAGLVNVDSTTVLFLMPSSKLAIELGFCKNQEPWRMFCIVRRRITMLSSTPQVTINPQAVMPSQLSPEKLNINVKIEVPHNIRPASCPVTQYNRSNSMDCHSTFRRTSDPRLAAKNFSSTKSKCDSQTLQLKNKQVQKNSGSNEEDPTKTEVCPKSSVSLDDKAAERNEKECIAQSNLTKTEVCPDLFILLDEKATDRNEKECIAQSSTSEHACSDKVQSTSSVLSNLFHVMPSKSIPFLETTHSELTTPEQSQCSSSSYNDDDSQVVEPETKTIESSSTSLDRLPLIDANPNDFPLEVPQTRYEDSGRSESDDSFIDSSDIAKNEYNTSDKDCRCLHAYQRHKEKLKPCIRKPNFTQTKLKEKHLDTKKQRTPQDTSSRRTVESLEGKLSSVEPQEDTDYPLAISSNSQPSCFSKYGIPLKRRPCLSERVKEIEKLFIKLGDQDSDEDSDSHESKTESSDDSDATIILPPVDNIDSPKEDVCSSPMDADQLIMTESTSDKIVTKVEDNTSWANGLEVVEAMLMEVEFLQVDEEVETAAKEISIEHFEVNDVSYNVIHECHEAVILKVQAPDRTNLSVNKLYTQITDAASTNGLVVNEPSKYPEEPVECSAQDNEATAFKEAVSLDQCLPQSIPFVTKKVSDEDLSVDKENKDQDPKLNNVENTITNAAYSIISKPETTLPRKSEATTALPNTNESLALTNHFAAQPAKNRNTNNKRAAEPIPYRYNGSSYQRHFPPPPKMRRLIDNNPRTHPRTLGQPSFYRSVQPSIVNIQNGLLTPQYPLRFYSQQLPFSLQRSRFPFPLRQPFIFPFQQRPIAAYRCYGDVTQRLVL